NTTYRRQRRQPMIIPPYPEYKSSGERWFGDIPAHWNVERLNRLAHIQPSNVDKHTKQDEIPVRLCNYTDVYKRTFIHNGIEFMRATATQAEIDKFTLQKGDVLITKDSEVWTDIAVPAYVTEELEGVLCGYHLTHIRPYTGIVGEFIFRSFQALPIAYQFWVSAKGVTRYGIDTYSIKSSTFLLPPLEEQAGIVRFLDGAEKQIRLYIRAKQKLIKLLNEQKQAIIQQAVTHGLNPNAPMKDSGAEWLGAIPAHWELRRNGQLFLERNETGFPELPILEVSLNTGVRIRDFEGSKRKQIMRDKAKYKRAAAGDIAYNMMRMWQGAVGVAPTDGLISPAYVIARPLPDTNSYYYEYLFRTAIYKAEVNK
ncbi:MAG: restriction endonuclease subunit S, partial [Spirosomaceae bacterium]|nr:restriction endonuclease subunit S [Spirosomataceae bacterium]